MSDNNALPKPQIQLYLHPKGWCLFCGVDRCPQDLVIRWEPGNPLGGIHQALVHVVQYHYYLSVEVMTNHQELVDRIHSNSNPEMSQLQQLVNTLYRSLPHCVLSYSPKLKEAERYAKLIPSLEPISLTGGGNR